MVRYTFRRGVYSQIRLDSTDAVPSAEEDGLVRRLLSLGSIVLIGGESSLTTPQPSRLSNSEQGRRKRGFNKKTLNRMWNVWKLLCGPQDPAQQDSLTALATTRTARGHMWCRHAVRALLVIAPITPIS